MNTQEVMYAERSIESLRALLNLNDVDRWGQEAHPAQARFSQLAVTHAIAAIVRGYGHVSQKIEPLPLPLTAAERRMNKPVDGQPEFKFRDKEW